ncbi:uncharacterized protein LOC143298601 [Babylonia areolata]|uniref:uncharacterized protein LOC143298601 n=1 Tax=Babylonia areolata TaxID=304850 RepID=UPI003FD21564
MAMYSKRDSGYKVGMLLFCVGVVAFVTGFATPHWAKFQFRISSRPSSLPSPSSSTARSPQQDWTEVEGHTGLWKYCFKVVIQPGDPQCNDVSTSSPGWMTAVKVVDCTAVGVMGLALAFFFCTNCVARKAAFTRLLEVATGLSGLMGVAGAAVYLWKSFTDDITENVPADQDVSLSWSFFLNAGGSVIVLLATFLIAVYNNPVKTRRAPTTTTTNNRVTTPTAPFPSLDRRAAATHAQGYAPSGSSAYVISAAMNASAPQLYPSLPEEADHI